MLEIELRVDEVELLVKELARFELELPVEEVARLELRAEELTLLELLAEEVDWLEFKLLELALETAGIDDARGL